MTSSIPQSSVLAPALFNIFFTDLVGGIEPILSKSAPLTKLNDAEKDAVQRDQDKLEKWAQKNLMRFKTNKKKPSASYNWVRAVPDLCTTWENLLRNSPAEKDSGILVYEKLDINQQCLEPRRPIVSRTASKEGWPVG